MSFTIAGTFCSQAVLQRGVLDSTPAEIDRVFFCCPFFACLDVWRGSVLNRAQNRTNQSIRMRCFYHQDREAIGSCKSCNKGLCAECAVDLGKGLACRGRCEADVQGVIQLIDRNVRRMDEAARLMDKSSSVLKHAISMRYATGLFLAVAGAIFTIFGAADLERFAFAFVLGIVFLLYGIYSIILARRFRNDKPQQQKPNE
jgi:hypothetical protein